MYVRYDEAGSLGMATIKKSLEDRYRYTCISFV